MGHLAKDCEVNNETSQHRRPATHSWVKVRRGKHSFASVDSMQKKWLPTGNRFISLSIPNAEKEQNNLEGEGDGPSSVNYIEDVIDRDLHLI